MSATPRAPALHVERSGRGRPLVLLHGWGLNLRVFDALRESLAATREVFAVDLPGHGRSAFDGSRRSLVAQAEDVLAALPSAFDLLGWSFGGQIALVMVASAPRRIERLVLVSTTPRFVHAPDWPAGLAPGVAEAFAMQLRTDYTRTIGEFLELQVRGSRDAERVLAALRRAVLTQGAAAADALAAGLDILRTADLRPQLAAVAVPTLVLGGQYDRVIPPAATRALASALPDAVHHEFARAAHAPFLSHPREFAARVHAFIDPVADAAAR
jgi:pimeloyl-[acyl-carrier protein] methyl ester esterase